MKNFIQSILVCIELVMLLSCSKEVNLQNQVKPFHTESLFNSSRQSIPDSSTYNYDMAGQALFRHLKYYSGTLDPFTYLPTKQADEYRDKFTKYQNKIKLGKWTHQQIIDDWTNQKIYSSRQGNLIKEHQDALIQFLSTHPNPKAMWDWFVQKESEIKTDKSLSRSEKSVVLNQRAMVKYGILWRLENQPTQTTQGARVSSCDFWEQLFCYAGYISGLAGAGGPIGGSLALKNTSDALAKATAIGALAGVAVGAVEAVQNCHCNTDICDAPLTATYPFECFVPGVSSSLLVTAIGYGSIRPQSFDFDFFYNDDENNHLYHMVAPNGNDYIYLPGTNIQNTGAGDFAVRISSHCAADGTNPQRDIPSNLVGWINLNDLGKPFFTISGTDNLTVSDASNYSAFTYQIDGAYEQIQTSILWELIPSGYPNYSATGTITGGNTNNLITVRWDPHPGFATLKVTTTSHCNANGQDYSVVNYLNIHIQ